MRPSLARLLIVASLIAAAASQGTGAPLPPGSSAAASMTAGGGFGIKGDVRHLYPGATRSVRARITNPNSFSIRVVSLEIESVAADPERLTCDPTRYVRTRNWTGSVKVRPDSSTVVQAMRVSLLDSSPDACQGAHFSLRFSGTAVRG